MKLKQHTFLSYLFYWIGHIISLPMCKFDLGCLYKLYKWFLCKSGDFDPEYKVWEKENET